MNYLGEMMADIDSLGLDTGTRLKLYHSPDQTNHREPLELVKKQTSDLWRRSQGLGCYALGHLLKSVPKS
jgi:hypothetical protein